MATKKYIPYIDGIKGLACLAIMLGHYLGMYKYATYTSFQSPFLNIFKNRFLAVFISESCWLYLFFIVSGYLLSLQSIDTISQLIKKSVNRVMRFLFPMVGACVIIFFIYQISGPAKADISPIIINDSFAGSPITVNLVDIIIDPIKTLFYSGSEFNSPYWVIRYMFYSSIIIYICNYAKHKFSNKTFTPYIIAICGIAVSTILLGEIGFGCVMGMCVCWFEDKINQVFKKNLIPTIIIIVAFLLESGLHPYMFTHIRYIIPQFPNIFKFSSYYSSIYYALILIFLPRFKILTSIFSSKVFRYLGSISFGIYSFHWPVIITIGGTFFKNCCSYINPLLSFWLSLSISIILALIISILYHYTFEKLAFTSIKIINKKFINKN